MSDGGTVWLRPLLPGSYLAVPPVVAGPTPVGRSEAETERRIARLLDGGIDHVIDLTEDGELEPYRDHLPRRVRVSRVPLARGQAPSAANVRTALDAIVRAVASGSLVYVHDDAGIGRVGVVVGCLLAELGLGEGDVLRRLATLRAAVPGPPSPRLDEQRAVVRAWEARFVTPSISDLVRQVEEAGGTVGGAALYDPRWEREMRAMLVQSLLLEGVRPGARHTP